MWTPVLESKSLAQLYGVGKLFLKMENLQTTGSFKDRAMKSLLSHLKSTGVTGVVCSSGGNAGVACAFAGSELGLNVHVFVPETTREIMLERLKLYNAHVHLAGSAWKEADDAARKFLELPGNENLSYAPPFDHPKVWDGNANIVRELKDQLPVEPDVLVCSVGGGGLLAGLLQGLKEVNYSNTHVLAVETELTCCFEKSLKAKKLIKISTTSKITNSLSPPSVAQGVLDLGLERGKKISTSIVSDREAVGAVELFLNEHRFLVEASCGASFSALNHLSNSLEKTKEELKKMNVCVVVCGGSAITADILKQQKIDTSPQSSL